MSSSKSKCLLLFFICLLLSCGCVVEIRSFTQILSAAKISVVEKCDSGMPFEQKKNSVLVCWSCLLPCVCNLPPLRL